MNVCASLHQEMDHLRIVHRGCHVQRGAAIFVSLIDRCPCVGSYTSFILKHSHKVQNSFPVMIKKELLVLDITYGCRPYFTLRVG